MDIFKCIELNDFSKVKELVEKGENIYKTRNCPHYSTKDEELIKKYYDAGISTDESEIELPLTHTGIFCESDEIVNYLLDIYERDLEVLKNTNYKNALVAFPEDQTEELLSYSEFSVPKDEDLMKPVLLKKNNLESPKLAFMNKKSWKLIRKLEQNGKCDLNFIFPDGNSIPHKFAYFRKFSIAFRLLNSPLVDDDIKEKLLYSGFKGLLIEHADLRSPCYKNYNFSEFVLMNVIRNRDVERTDFILKLWMNNGNRTMQEVLKTELIEVVEYGDTTVIHEIVRFDLDEKLNLDFDVEILFPQKDGFLFYFFQYWMTIDGNKKQIQRFVQKYPKILEQKSKDNFTILHYAVMTSNFEIIEMIHGMYEDKDIFTKDDEAAIKSIENSLCLFMDDDLENTKILKLILQEKFESFLNKHGSRIIHRLFGIGKGCLCFRFLNSLPFFEFDTDGKYSIYELLLYSDKRSFEEIIKTIDIPDWTITKDDGMNLFMVACSFVNDNPEFLKSIIRKQPEVVHHITSNNSTCLHFISDHKTIEIAKILVDMGVDHQVLNKDNKKAVWYALHNYEIFSFLLPFESDEDLNEELDNLYAFYFNSKTFKLILNRNIDLFRPVFGGIPFIFSHFKDDILDMVYKHLEDENIEVDINVKDVDGNSFIPQFVKHFQMEASEKLLNHFKDQIDFASCKYKGQHLFQIIADVSAIYSFRRFFDVVKDNCFDEFLKYFKELTFENVDNLLYVLEFLNVEFIRDNFQLFMNFEQAVRRIYSMYPYFSDILSENPSIVYNSIKNCNNEKLIEFQLIKLKPEIFDQIFCDENILHVICEKNNQRMIEDFLMFLSTEQIEKFSKQIFNEKKPYDLLNDELKEFFENELRN